MKTVIFSAIIAVLSSSAWAADSTWYLCDNGTLAVNLLEHRAANGNGRAFSVALMFGANLVQGEVDAGDDNSGTANITSSKNSFSGTISLGQEPGPNVIVDGTLTLSGQSKDISVNVLGCKVLDNN